MPTLHVHILLGLSDTHRRSLMPFNSVCQVRLRIRATLVGLGRSGSSHLPPAVGVCHLHWHPFELAPTKSRRAWFLKPKQARHCSTGRSSGTQVSTALQCMAFSIAIAGLFTSRLCVF